MKIEDLGYDDFFESNRLKSKWSDFDVARVIAEHKGAYAVKNVSGEYLAKITGKQIYEANSRKDYPAVGDWVVIKPLDDGKAVIRGILPRKTTLGRKYSGKNDFQLIAANIDVALVVEAVDRDYNLNRLERYFAMALDGGIKPAVILNKTDLLSSEKLSSVVSQIKDRFEKVDLLLTSALTDKGTDELKKYIRKGVTYCFLGSSGAGKSSLINRLLEHASIETRPIGERSGRGKHVTTAREMHFLKNGGIVIDNPGMREVGLTELKEGASDLFAEITSLAKNCKFMDCTHVHEPGCQVLAAVQSGRLDQGRYANYVGLKKETDYYEMTEAEKKKKDRHFGKFMKNAIKDFKKFGHKDYGD